MDSSSDESVAVADGAEMQIPLINGTEFTIESFQAKRLDEVEFSQNLLPAGSLWAPGDAIEVPFEVMDIESRDLASDSEAIRASQTEDGVYLANPVYSFRFTATDGSLLDIRMVDLDELAEAADVTIEYDEGSGLAYLTYLLNREPVSTLEGEQYMADAAAAVAQAQVEE